MTKTAKILTFIAAAVAIGWATQSAIGAYEEHQIEMRRATLLPHAFERKLECNKRREELQIPSQPKTRVSSGYYSTLADSCVAIYETHEQLDTWTVAAVDLITGAELDRKAFASGSGNVEPLEAMSYSTELTEKYSR